MKIWQKFGKFTPVPVESCSGLGISIVTGQGFFQAGCLERKTPGKEFLSRQIPGNFPGKHKVSF